MLSPGHEVTAVQYAPDAITYHDIEAQVESILPASEYIIVAESFSGPLAVMIASQKPIGLRGVVFVATFAKTPLNVPKFLTYIIDIAPIKSRLLMRLAQPFLMGKWATPEFTVRFMQVMKAVPASTIAGRLREVLESNVVKQIASIEVPTVYLTARGDRLIPSRMASDFDRSLNTHFVIEGPHFLLQANAAESSKHILDFTSRID